MMTVSGSFDNYREALNAVRAYEREYPPSIFGTKAHISHDGEVLIHRFCLGREEHLLDRDQGERARRARRQAYIRR